MIKVSKTIVLSLDAYDVLVFEQMLKSAIYNTARLLPDKASASERQKYLDIFSLAERIQAEI